MLPPRGVLDPQLQLLQLLLVPLRSPMRNRVKTRARTRPPSQQHNPLSPPRPQGAKNTAKSAKINEGITEMSACLEDLVEVEPPDLLLQAGGHPWVHGGSPREHHVLVHRLRCSNGNRTDLNRASGRAESNRENGRAVRAMRLSMSISWTHLNTTSAIPPPKAFAFDHRAFHQIPEHAQGGGKRERQESAVARLRRRSGRD